MGSMFGKEAAETGVKARNNNVAVKNKITEKDRAILDLKNSRDKLKRYKKKLEEESVKLHEQAKSLVKVNQKERALLVLKLKKHKETAVDGLEKQLLQVFELIDTIEWESTNIQVFNALKEGTAALNKLHEELSVDDVEKLLDETMEAIETENRINSIIAGQSEVLNDEELQSELDLLLGESVTIAKPDNSTQLNLPIAPSNIILPEAPTAATTISVTTSNQLVAS